jgi:hypothetical protein
MNKSKPSRFFEPLAVAVASGQTIRAAADVAGCATQTAYNISASHEFRQRVSEIRTEAVTAAVGKLSDAASEAVSTLRQLLDASNDPPVRLNAAKAILAAITPMAEFGELRQRLDSIENGSQLRVAK